VTPLERITKRVNRDGDVNASDTPRPELTLEEFFEGNQADGCICCNLSPMPSPADVHALLERIRARDDVADVRIEITMFDDPDFWPFSDTVWIVTSASPDDVHSWFDDSIAPDECDDWAGEIAREQFPIPTGMHAVRCWWD